MNKPAYTDRAALENNIAKCEKTIITFQEAIAKEHETIFELKTYIKELDVWEKYKLEAGL